MKKFDAITGEVINQGEEYVNVLVRGLNSKGHLVASTDLAPHLHPSGPTSVCIKKSTLAQEGLVFQLCAHNAVGEAVTFTTEPNIEAAGETDGNESSSERAEEPVAASIR
jgi:hypothetical protein